MFCAVRTPSGEPVTGIKVLVDGRVVDNARGLALEVTGGADCMARAGGGGLVDGLVSRNFGVPRRRQPSGHHPLELLCQLRVLRPIRLESDRADLSHQPQCALDVVLLDEL